MAKNPDAPLIPADEVESIIEREVRARVAREVERVLPEMAANWAQPGNQGASTDNLMQGLALAIAQLTDQGSGRQKRVPPEVLIARQEAHDRMIARIKLAQAKGEQPFYKLTGKVFLDEQLINPIWIDSQHRQQPQEIGWPGIPNSLMDPVNDVAKEIFAEYLTWVGEDFVQKPRVDMVTSRGVVIMRQNQGPDPGASRTPFGDPTPGGVMVMREGRPEPATRLKHVLGTVAEPAREQVA